MKGNRSNHPLKWARDEDLKELKERLFHFIDNDFMGLTHKVNFQDVKLNFLIIAVGIILAMMALALTLIFRIL